MSNATRTINGKKYILKKYYDIESLAHAKADKENAALREALENVLEDPCDCLVSDITHYAFCHISVAQEALKEPK